MEELENKFTQVAELVKKVKTQPSDEELLKLYGLFKQITVGDINIEKPSLLSFKAKAKYNAWYNLRGKKKIDCIQEYVLFAVGVIKKYGLKEN
jgi:diazepam-binding inhibitor (GABA receptor modulating acyl-CoA-binding protein)